MRLAGVFVKGVESGVLVAADKVSGGKGVVWGCLGGGAWGCGLVVVAGSLMLKY